MRDIRFQKLNCASNDIANFLSMIFGEALQLRPDEIERANELIRAIDKAADELDELKQKAAARFARIDKSRGDDYNPPFDWFAATALAVGVQSQMAFDARRLRRTSTVIPEMPGVESPEVEDGDALIAAAKVCEFCSEAFNSEAGYLAHECSKTPFGIFEG